jgi:CRP-like cAMP-binding protein
VFDLWIRAGAVASAERLGVASALAPHVSSQPNMNRLLVLKQIDLFGHLSLDEIALLAEAMEFETRIAGERIINEGEPARELFVITEGSVTIVKGTEKRRSRPSALVSASARWVCSTIRSDQASAVCREDCALLKLEKNRFVSLARQRPEISLQMCRVLSQRIRATNEHVVS